MHSIQDINWLKKCYIDKGMTQWKIADLIGCHRKTVGKYLKKYGIKTCKTKTIEERFWEKVDKFSLNDCWNWTGFLNHKGYGRIRNNSKYTFAHRFSYELHKKPVPEGLFVCHKCDNPSCINPNHLFLGTHEGNMKDMVQKGRSCKGEEHRSAKLKEEKVIEIKKLYKTGKFSYRELGKKYNVDHKTICNIINRKTWKHVKE